MAKVAERIQEKEIGAEPSWLIRGVRWIVLLPVGIGAWTVTKAQAARQFYRDVKLEMKRVTWPTREEVVQTTAVTILVVCFFGYFLWGANWVLSRVVTSLINFLSN